MDNKNSFDDNFRKKMSEVASSYGITLPDVKMVSTKKFHDPSNYPDFEELEKINEAIYYARIAFFEVTDALARFDSKLAKAKTVYERAWRREYLGATEKTDAAKKSRADLAVEQLEDNVIVFTQAKEDLKRISNTLKIELQSLQTLSSNLRQQLTIP